jgi:uncharacterized GH25 family protein
MLDRVASVALGLALSVIAGSVAAHDFWLQPTSFHVAPGVRAPVDLLVGHGRDRSAWGQPASRVRRLKSLSPAGAEMDLRPVLAARSGADQPFLTGFVEPGVHLLALESNPAISELPAPRFAMYLREEGLTEVARLREEKGLTNTPGRELYSRRAKALVRVGDASAPQAQVSRPVGMDLEIVPERDPYGLKAGERLPVRVLFHGRPLAGALVKLIDLEADEKPFAMARTDASGRAAFEIPQDGAWLVNVVWTTPLANNPRAEFETVFSSLTFGWPQADATTPQ